MTTRIVRTRSAKVEGPHPLEHLIPDSWLAEDYISRECGGVVDLDIIEEARTLKHNVLLEGPTGSAKTSLVYAAAAGGTGKVKRQKIDGVMTDVNIIDSNRRRPVVNVPCNGAISPPDLFGHPTIQPDGTFAFVPGDLTLAVMFGGIGYFDECNFMPPRVGAVVHGLLDKRRTMTLMDAAGYTTWIIGDKAVNVPNPTQIKAHPDFQAIGAYNPDYAGTRPLNEAFKNRFAIKLPFDYSNEVEKKLVLSSTMLKVASKLRATFNSGEIRTPVSTNLLIELEEFAASPALGFRFAMENFLSAFNTDERPAVQAVLELHATDIRKDLFDEEVLDESNTPDDELQALIDEEGE